MIGPSNIVSVDMRDFSGRPVPEFCSDNVGRWSPNVDYAKNAARDLKRLVTTRPDVAPWSCHFIIEGQEIGAWSREQELLKTYYDACAPQASVSGVCSHETTDSGLSDGPEGAKVLTWPNLKLHV
jgi:hypothetical protein